MTNSDFSRQMEAIHDAVGQRNYTAASRACVKLAKAIRETDALASFHLRITAGFLDLIEHGTPNPHALEDLEALLAAAVCEIDYDDRVEIDLAGITEFCRLFRLSLTNEVNAVASTYRAQRSTWLTFGGSIEIMSLVIASLCLLNRDLRQATSVAEVPMLVQLQADISHLMKRRGLHRYVSEVLTRCSEFIGTLAHGVVIDGDGGGTSIFGVFPARNPWMLCAESQLRVSTALARRVIMSPKYSINAKVVNMYERNDAPINIDARSMDVDASVGKAASCQPSVNSTFDHSADYTRIVLRGEAYRFGALQASIIRILHEVSATPMPWVSERDLLTQTGSRSEGLRHVFRNHDREALFETDALGRVRLRV